VVELVDTHCHIHSASGGNDPTYQKWAKDGPVNIEGMIEAAREAGVTRTVCVGTDLADSERAIDFVAEHDGMWASIGIHPHEAKRFAGDEAALKRFAHLATKPKVVAVGEIGLDFYYSHSPKAEQLTLLRFQLDVAAEHRLPVIFHVRDAFEDFWPVFEEYQGLTGVIHSFSAGRTELDAILEHGLYVGVNGIATFSKNEAQLEAYKAIPLENLLLETDAPFLTPTPYRGTINESKHVLRIAEFMGGLREQSLETIASASTANALNLFNLS
jgi:TatD DNase family protein